MVLVDTYKLENNRYDSAGFWSNQLLSYYCKRRCLYGDARKQSKIEGKIKYERYKTEGESV